MLPKPDNPKLKEPERDVTVSSIMIPKMKQTFLTMIKPRMLCVIFMQVYRGFLNAYYTGELVTRCMGQRHEKDDSLVRKAQLGAAVMIPLGVMEVVGAVAAGRLIKRFGKRFGVHLLTVVGIICCVLMISLLVKDVSFGWPYYVASAFWGFADSTVSTSLIALLVHLLRPK